MITTQTNKQTGRQINKKQNNDNNNKKTETDYAASKRVYVKF